RLNISFFNKESQKSTPLPFIVHVNKNYGLMHYVVILEIHNDYLLIADPDPTVKTKKVDFEYFANIWTGIAMFMVPNENYHIIKEKQDNLWGVARRLLRYKLTVLKIVALTLFSTIITIAGSIFLQKIVDLFVVEKDINLLNIVTLSLVFDYLFHGIFMYWQGYLSIALGKKLSVDFLLKYMKHLFELPISFFETRRAGEITSRFVDANSIIDTLARTAITTLLNVGTILVIGTVLVFFSPQLFLLSMTVVPVYLILMLSCYRLFDKLNGQCMEKNAQLDSQIIEDLHGIESIKSLYVERKMYGSLRKKFLEALHVNCHFSNMTVLQRSIKDIADLLIELTVLYVGSPMAIRGQITIGKLVAFSSLSGYFLGPIEAIINLQGDLQTARVANKRLNQVMRIEPETKLDKNLVELSENSQTNQIIFSDISFEYKYGQEILHDINLRISRNESTAIVGLSGSGKTTLLKLLVGFYQPSKGTICINNQNIATLKKKSIRTYINYVPQTPYIFSGSVRENIALATKRN
ncbi:putative ATP synthase F0, A subunit, partial [Lentilactobacillus buchneri ATCC 11577]